METEFLDLLDKKIISELDENCRQSDAQIARKARTSRAVIGYRIKQLEKKGVISNYITSVNLGKLGLGTYKIFFRLHNLTKEKEEDFFNFLKGRKEVIHCLRNEGNFNASAAIAVKDLKELDSFLFEIKSRFAGILKDYSITIVLYSKIFKLRKFMLGSENTIKVESYSNAKKTAEIDEKDIQILKILSQDARNSVIEIAKKTKMTIDVVRYRIKKLVDSGIITNFRVLLDFSKIGCFHYVFLVKFGIVKKNDEGRILQWSLKQPEVMYVSKKIGDWEYELNVLLRNLDELNAFIENLKSEFSDILDSYNLVLNSKAIKLNYFPY